MSKDDVQDHENELIAFCRGAIEQPLPGVENIFLLKNDLPYGLDGLLLLEQIECSVIFFI